MSLDRIISDIRTNNEVQKKLLESHYPNIPQTTMFMDDVQIAVRETSIKFLRQIIHDNRCVIHALDKIND